MSEPLHDLSCAIHVHSTCSDGAPTVPDAVGSGLGGALLVTWAVRGWCTMRRVPARPLQGLEDE